MSKQCFAYIRVSTQKQAEKKVSLKEQRYAIEQYAERCGLEITRWFEEKQSASKSGRPKFNEMMNLLRKQVASGVIMHKIDRSSRNAQDWADVSAFIDVGVDFHFAVENLDLTSRGGRLAADMLAAVAADYSRNLRAEINKGMIGRLKEGYYPWAAPIGYLDAGGGNIKPIDPTAAPMIRRAFQLYATGEYSVESLRKRIRIKNRSSGRLLSKNAVSAILRNPFYIGVIRMPKSGQTYAGNHTPLISKRLFEDVQDILDGRVRRKQARHSYSYARMFKCPSCKRALTAERQKGHIYYRCHTKLCGGRPVKEDTLDQAASEFFVSIQLCKAGKRLLKFKLEAFVKQSEDYNSKRRQSVQLRLKSLNEQLERLTDALIDGLIEKDAYSERRKSLVRSKEDLEGELNTQVPNAAEFQTRISKMFELLETPKASRNAEDSAGFARILRIVSSNRSGSGKDVEIEPRKPWSVVQKLNQGQFGAPERGRLPDEEIANELFDFLLSTDALELSTSEFDAQSN